MLVSRLCVFRRMEWRISMGRERRGVVGVGIFYVRFVFICRMADSLDFVVVRY